MTTGIDPQSGEESAAKATDPTGPEVREIVSAASRSVRVMVEVPAPRSRQALDDAPPIRTRRQRPGQSKWRGRLIVLGVLACAVAATAAYWKPLSTTVRSYINPNKSLSLSSVQTYVAKRGELRVTMVEEGKLRAVNNSTIRMGVQGKILWLAEPGAMVKKGDKLAVIDMKQYEDQKKLYEADLETNIKQLEIAEKQVPIAEADGKAAVSNAVNAWKTAELALKTLTTVDVPKKLNEMEGVLNDARTKLTDQQKKRQDLQTQLDSMLQEGKEKDDLASNLRIAKQTEASLKRTVDTAEDQRKLYRSYTYLQELETKKRAVENAKVDVEKAKVNAENGLLSKQADVQRLKNSVTRMRNNIKQYEDQIARGTAYAPTDGLVFYGGPDLERYGMSPESIRVGADWYSNYPIMSIPDLSSFQVTVPIAEVYRGRVSIGMLATVLVDAVPGLVLEGKLLSVSNVSRPKVQFDNTSPPVYDAVLSLNLADPRMVAGMTVRVEIVTGVLPDVLFVPVEAVFNEEGKTAAFFWVEGADGKQTYVEKRPVVTGQSSDHFVEIKKGIDERDRLLLSRPTAYVTPGNYREMVDAMFPQNGPTTARFAGPSSRPAGVMQAGASPTSRPAGVSAPPGGDFAPPARAGRGAMIVPGPLN